MLASLPGGQSFNPNFYTPKSVTCDDGVIVIQFFNSHNGHASIRIPISDNEAVESQLKSTTDCINQIYENLEESSEEEPQIEQLEQPFSYLCSADTSEDDSEAENQLLKELEAEELEESESLLEDLTI